MKRISLLMMLFAFFATTTFAQDTEPTPTEGEWKRGIGIGLDFSQLLQINPRVGAGENRLGLGGAVTFFANWKKGKHSWDTNASWQIGVQKLGGGQFVFNNDIKVPWQKSIDELRFATKYGYAITEDKKWYAATELTLLTQLLPVYAGNFMKDISPTQDQDPIAKMFSPAQITYSIGIDWKPNDNFSLYYSPIAAKFIIVADDNIADDGATDDMGNLLGTSVHGNPWTSPTDFGNVNTQFGSLLKAQYQNKFWSFQDGDKEAHRILFKTYLSLYYDYLQGAKKDEIAGYKNHVDTDWGTETSLNIFKGLQVVLTTNLFYDWDVAVQETDYSQPGGVSGNLVRKPSFTQQLLIKYAINF